MAMQLKNDFITAQKS